jgi:hypothetical protein
MCRSRYEADLSVSVVSFISSSMGYNIVNSEVMTTNQNIISKRRLYDCIPLHCHSGSSKYDVIDSEVMATKQTIISKRRLYDCIPLHFHSGSSKSDVIEDCMIAYRCIVMLVLVNMTHWQRSHDNQPKHNIKEKIVWLHTAALSCWF